MTKMAKFIYQHINVTILTKFFTVCPHCPSVHLCVCHIPVYFFCYFALFHRIR